MTYSRLSFIGLCGGLIIGACSSLYFLYIQKINFNAAVKEHDILKRSLKTVKTEVLFLAQHRNELTFLLQKGWFTPHSRLMCSDRIHQERNLLKNVRFTFEPQIEKTTADEKHFKISRIIIETESPLDQYIYDFIMQLSTNFPGILVLRKLSLMRHEKTRVKGEILFEWFALGDKRHEE